MARPVTHTPEHVLSLVVHHMNGDLKRGVRDCCTQPCRVFGDLFGVDPLGPVSYRNLRGAWRFVRGYGGAKECADTIAAKAELIECEPFPGAIGRVIHPTAELELTLAICVDESNWAVKADSGFFLVQNYEKCWGPSWA